MWQYANNKSSMSAVLSYLLVYYDIEISNELSSLMKFVTLLHTFMQEVTNKSILSVSLPIADKANVCYVLKHSKDKAVIDMIHCLYPNLDIKDSVSKLGSIYINSYIHSLMNCICIVINPCEAINDRSKRIFQFIIQNSNLTSDQSSTTVDDSIVLEAKQRKLSRATVSPERGLSCEPSSLVDKANSILRYLVLNAFDSDSLCYVARAKLVLASPTEYLKHIGYGWNWHT